ncbi:hypothetical protein L596_028795 [Steinernema carpocapsae]|uniref:3-beta hydroxysteroid dehydrogenase/isomerase domain-containing protein n=1 Tax=Steinernema carpocapsae TaxID=34508 RepID=A0A4V5ZXZ7_STECR|nr:hypothetical protein L596_028795 [Steinernema carpocapsae]
MRMCLIGGGGYFGQNLAMQLQKEGHFVVALDLNFPKFDGLDLDLVKLQKVKGSVLDPHSLDEALQDCDACFHLAGYGMSGGASLEREKIMLINVKGTDLVMDHCVQNGVKRFVFASSIGVIFGHKEVYDIDESEPYLTQFMNPYCESKCIAEQKVLKMNGKGDLKTVALRFRGIYGPGEPRSTLRTADMCMRGFIKATFEKSEPCLTQYSSMKNSAYAMRLAEEALRKENSPAAGQPYNIVDDGPPVEAIPFWFPIMDALEITRPSFKIPYHLAYFFAIVCELLYYVFKIEPMFTRFEVNLISLTHTFNISKAKRDLGYAPMENHDLTETIVFLKNYYKQKELEEVKDDGALDKDQQRLKLLIGSVAVLWSLYHYFFLV